MNPDKKRSENWTAEDKMLLQELVKERVLVIENKNTDTNTNTRKVAAWADLLTSFNSMRSGGERTVAQLRVQWGSLKAAEKRKIAVERKSRQATGGGPPPPETPTDYSNLQVWLPQEFVTDKNEFDSDSITQIIEVAESAAPEVVEELATPNRQASPAPQAPTPAEASPVHLAEPARQTESARQPRTKKRKTCRHAENPAKEIATVEIRCREELHQFQMGTEKKRRENEEKKNKLLQLKEQLLLTKIEYFKKKTEL